MNGIGALKKFVRLFLCFAGGFCLLLGEGWAGTQPAESSPTENFGSALTPVIDRVGERHERGRQLYNYRCYYCHGYSGDAKTLASSFMQPSPRDFQTTSPQALTRDQMIDAVTQGRPGTGMVSFTYYLSTTEIEEVVGFIRQEFMIEQRENTRYHTPENGWPDHERYRVAYPFATGELALDTPQQRLSQQQRQGLQLFLTTCVSCHDRGRVEDEGAVWELRALSYPRNNFSYTEFDATTSASVYAKHDQIKEIDGMTEQEQQGEQLFQANCAFCHGADGSGRNWIGSFLDSHPRDLTERAFMAQMDRQLLRGVIEEGLLNTSMPAWKAVLNSVQIDAIISYISRAFQPVRGSSE